jgi:hypothetical protein
MQVKQMHTERLTALQVMLLSHAISPLMPKVQPSDQPSGNACLNFPESDGTLWDDEGAPHLHSILSPAPLCPDLSAVCHWRLCRPLLGRQRDRGNAQIAPRPKAPLLSLLPIDAGSLHGICL